MTEEADQGVHEHEVGLHFNRDCLNAAALWEEIPNRNVGKSEALT